VSGIQVSMGHSGDIGGKLAPFDDIDPFPCFARVADTAELVRKGYPYRPVVLTGVGGEPRHQLLIPYWALQLIGLDDDTKASAALPWGDINAATKDPTWLGAFRSFLALSQNDAQGRRLTPPELRRYLKASVRTGRRAHKTASR
jgi:hypothetical protein